MNLLHVHAPTSISLYGFLDEVLLHTLLDVLKLIPLLFLTYLLMEFIEHKASESTARFLERSGPIAPAIGAAAGLLPQCGFSASAANLFSARVISFGTLIAVFLSTSDEMLPILISGSVGMKTLLFILLYKFAVALFVGFALDFVLKIFGKKKEEINIDEICDNDNCHCERGIFYSALHHTLTITLFVVLATLILNTVIFFIGEERIGALVGDVPVLSHFFASLIGLIPNCASSVVLSTLCKEGIISVGTMLAGLFSGAGVGLLVLFKVNKKKRENLLAVLVLVLTGTAFGLLAELIPALKF